MSRIQQNIVSSQERRFINWACARMPATVTSDHLTLLGVFGACLVLLGYIAARANPAFLCLSAVGYVVHWFGDSLDGSLARHRNVTRPRYGYFLDHSVDAICILMMFGGMGLSPHVRMDVALFVVMGYFALSIHVFLKNHVTGTFQLTFIALGPTEVRMIFMAITLWMYIAGSFNLVGGAFVSDYDVALLIVGGVFLSLFLINTVSMIFKLRAIEGDGRKPMAAVVEPARRAPGRPVIVADGLRERMIAVEGTSTY